MSRRSKSRGNNSSIHLFGFLSLAAGAALLFSVIKYAKIWRYQAGGFRYSAVVLAFLLLVWGLLKILGVWNKKSNDQHTRDRDEFVGPGFFQKRGIPRVVLWVITGGLHLSLGILFLERQPLIMEYAGWIAIAIAIGWGIWAKQEFGYWRAKRENRLIPRNRISLPVPGAVFLVIMFVTALGSMIGRSNMMMLVFSLMAGPFVVNGWFIYSMLKRTHVSRSAPKTAMAGESVSVQLTFENRKRFFSSWLMNVSDSLENENEALQAGVLFARVPPRSNQSGHYRMRLMQRGWYRMGPLRVSTRFPLGLVERGLVFDDYTEILVLPRLGKLLPAWNRDSITAPELVQKRDPRPGAFDDEFHRIREYHAGDNPRAIHWRSSARHNELMVREFYPTRDRNLVVLLDLYLPPRPNDEDRERVELAVSFAATVCVEHMRQSRSSKVFVAASGLSETQWEGAAGLGSMESILETLAQVEAHETASSQKIIENSSMHRSGATKTVFVTTRPEESSDEPVWDSQDFIQSSGDEIIKVNLTQDALSHLFQLD